MSYIKLHLACGEDYKEDYINVDNDTRLRTDKCFDITKFPYPFEDNTFKELYIKGTFYYMKNPALLLKEFARIVRPGGKIIIRDPHGTSYACFTCCGDTHLHVTENSFDDYFLKLIRVENLLKRVKVEHIYIHRWKKFIPFKRFFRNFLIGIYDDIEHTFEVIENDK